jgi:hypothetical protein
VPEPSRINHERSSSKVTEHLQMIHVILTWQGINPDHEEILSYGAGPGVGQFCSNYSLRTEKFI